MRKQKQSGEVVQIVCPACQSRITSDGKTLQTRSEFLTDLIEGEEDFKKAESAIEKLEAQLKAANDKIKELETENAKLKQPAPAKEGEKSATGKSGRVGRLW